MMVHQTSTSVHKRRVHDPEVCGTNEASDCQECQQAGSSSLIESWPAKGQYGPGDVELVRELGLRRPPYPLSGIQQIAEVLRLLDLELTCRRYPQYGEMVRTVLRRIMEGPPL